MKLPLKLSFLHKSCNNRYIYLQPLRAPLGTNKLTLIRKVQLCFQPLSNCCWSCVDQSEIWVWIFFKDHTDCLDLKMTFQHEVDRIFVIDWSRCYFLLPVQMLHNWNTLQINWISDSFKYINKYIYIDFTPWHLCFQICSNTQLIWQSRVYVYIIANITCNKKPKNIKSKSKWKRYTLFFIRSFSFATLNAKGSSDFWTTLFYCFVGGKNIQQENNIFWDWNCSLLCGVCFISKYTTY